MLGNALPNNTLGNLTKMADIRVGVIDIWQIKVQSLSMRIYDKQQRGGGEFLWLTMDNHVQIKRNLDCILDAKGKRCIFWGLSETTHLFMGND